MIGFGFALERVVLRPLLGRPVVAVIMATIGLGADPARPGADHRSAARREALPLPIGDEPIVHRARPRLPPIQVLGAVVAIAVLRWPSAGSS